MTRKKKRRKGTMQNTEAKEEPVSCIAAALLKALALYLGLVRVGLDIGLCFDEMTGGILSIVSIRLTQVGLRRKSALGT